MRVWHGKCDNDIISLKVWQCNGICPKDDKSGSADDLVGVGQKPPWLKTPWYKIPLTKPPR